MMRIFIIMTLFLSIGVLSAQEIKFGSETVDIGVQPANTEVKRQVSITNVGKAPLILTDVKSSCGCTIPEWPKDPILPGKSAKLTIAVKRGAGTFSKVIEVFSNDTQQSRRVLRVKGEFK